MKLTTGAPRSVDIVGNYLVVGYRCRDVARIFCLGGLKPKPPGGPGVSPPEIFLNSRLPYMRFSAFLVRKMCL